MHHTTEELVERAHSIQAQDPTVVKVATDALLDLLEELEDVARAIQRGADEVQVALSAGLENEGVAGTVALYKSKSGVMLRDALKLRECILAFRSHSLEFQRADRQIRASLAKAGHDVPSGDLSASDISAAPQIATT